MTEQEMKKSVEKLVEDILKTEQTESVEKAMPTSLPANGGKDEIKSGSPHEEKQALMGEKSDEAKKAEEDKDEDDKKKKKEDKDEKKSEMKKAEDCDEDDKKKKDKKDDKKDKDDKKPAFMKKSIDELSTHLDADELELIKAWREESTEEVAKAETPVSEVKAEEAPVAELHKSLAKVLEDTIAPLKKSLEDKDTLIKAMSDKIEKMASQPAYDRRSIASLETLEKSGAESSTQELTKSQIAAKMVDMQLAGKGITSHHISEFEATGNISDAKVRNIVFKELKLN